MNKYSIVSYVNNRATDERISIGLIMINENECKIRFSDDKLNFVRILNDRNHSFLIKELDSWIKHKFSPDAMPYETGILSFSQLKIFNSELTDEIFTFYFNKWIDNG